MMSQRFNPETDLAPMPFDESIRLSAWEMKKSGLVWRPHVGCFVWDRDEIIKPASPFPDRVYFILSLGRFIEIFETIEQTAEKLVWLPTWYQAHLLYRQLAGTDAAMNQRRPGGHRVSCVEKLLHVYGLIIDALKEKNHRMPSQN